MTCCIWSQRRCHATEFALMTHKRSRHRSTIVYRRVAVAQLEQSTATARAAQTCLIRASLSRPIRSTSTARDTLSTESRLTAERRGTGSSPGSSTTSLTRPRIVVVHGAINARRCLGITASRESTTTGRRPICGISHHHTSPRPARAVKMRPQLDGTRRGRPTHPARRAGDRRRRRNSRLPRRRGGERVEQPEPRLRGPRR